MRSLTKSRVEWSGKFVADYRKFGGNVVNMTARSQEWIEELPVYNRKEHKAVRKHTFVEE